MMLGKHDNEVANASGLGRIKKNISNPLACRIVDSPHVIRDSDTLAGEFRRGTTILITDLMYRVGTQTGSHDMGMGLADMGWSIELFKIHESEAERPIEQFLETMEHVTEYLNNQVADEGNITVHMVIVAISACKTSASLCHVGEHLHDIVYQSGDGP